MNLGLHLITAAGGPVIPKFGGASNCVVQNHQFCGSWFTSNFSKVFKPAIIQHIAAVGKDNIDLRVVMHGDGIGLVQDAVANQRLQGQITDLKNMGVHFLVCNNTLTSRKIDPASLFDIWPEDIVPSGVAEVAKLQQEWFAYIKP